MSNMNTFAQRYAKAWCSQQPDSVAAFFSENGSLSVNEDAAAAGRPAISEVARGFMIAFPDMVVTMDKIERQAQGVVFHWTLSGSNTGPGGTGKHVCISGYEVWQIGDGGLITESKGQFDALEYQRQLEHGVHRDTE